MKSLNTKLMILLAGFSLLGVGCGSSGSFQSQNAAVPTTVTDSGNGVTPVTPPGVGTGTGTGTTTGSNQVEFTPVDMNEFGAYVASHSLNMPSNIKLTVNLKDVGGGYYAGDVKISYVDVNQQYTGTFTVGTGRNQSIKGMYDNDLLEAQYNYWFNLNGKTVFTGFFQDQLGGIVLVIDNVVNQGDGQGSSSVSGSVYYKNFAQSYRNGNEATAYRKCWYIRQGPFSCRADSVINKSSSTITDGGYRKLGTFSGLSVSAAFK